MVLAGCYVVPVGQPAPRPPVEQASPAASAPPPAPRVASEATGSRVVTGYDRAARELVESEGTDEDAPWHALAAHRWIVETRQFIADAHRDGTWTDGLRYQTAEDGTLSEQEMMQHLDRLAARVDAAWRRARPIAHRAWKRTYGATSPEALAKLEELGKPERVERHAGQTCWIYDAADRSWCWTRAGRLVAEHVADAGPGPSDTADASPSAPAPDPAPAPAQPSGSYKKVSIFNGQANCAGGTWAQETAVILDSDGYYKECDIFNGQCNAPGTWYQGKAVIKDSDGYYKECDIFNGKCDAPGTWYQGDAVVWCPD